MHVTLTALGFLIGSIAAGYALRHLIRWAGIRWQQYGAAVNTMANIAFWGLVIVGLVMAVQVLAAPAISDALAAIANYGPALLAAVAVLVSTSRRVAPGRGGRSAKPMALYGRWRRRLWGGDTIAVVIALGLMDSTSADSTARWHRGRRRRQPRRHQPSVASAT
jgi:hypothetical protein